MKQKLVLTNVKIVGNGRRDTMEGKKYWVFPVVILVEGVHNGSSGAVLYKRQDMAKYCPAWNYKPVVVYHPQNKKGGYISANHPEVLTKSKIGVILNNRMVGPEQHAEAWLEEARVYAVNNSSLTKAIQRGLRVEVSTGLIATFVEKEGTWNGEEYKMVAKEYRPDHLAVLPDQVGACSLKDGCGMFTASKAVPLKKMVVMQDAMNRALGNKSASNCSCQKKGNSMLKNKKKAKKITKAAFVEALVESSPIWNEDDVELLMNMDQDTLKKLKAKDDEAIEANEELKHKEETNKLKEKLKAKRLAAANAMNEMDDEEDEEEAAPVQNKKKIEKKDEKSQDLALNKLLKNADPELRKRIKRSMKMEANERARLTDIILSNESNEFEEKELASFDVLTLKKMAQIAVQNSADEEDDDDDESFLGNMSAVRKQTNKKEDDVPVLLPPTMNMRKAKEEDEDK